MALRQQDAPPVLIYGGKNEGGMAALIAGVLIALAFLQFTGALDVWKLVQGLGESKTTVTVPTIARPTS